MIGLVVVSHSRALADAAVGLAAEMVHGGGPTVTVAAGLDADTFGTDATAVAAAIEEADSPDGVLVLMDLGSAVMSAELALELVDPEIAAHVRLCSAPLVEGLVAAVVTAGTGASLEAVTAEALRGLAAKQDHLGDVPVAAEKSADSEVSTAAEIFDEVEIVNEMGIHARPAGKLVTMLGQYDAEVSITNLTRDIGPVVADSMIMLVTLDTKKGDRLRVSGTGPAAAAAVETAVAFIAAGLGD
ncbi:dihydroxyacetone kinase phosphoryl donor subunit DhaM [Mycolicibacterium komossense]|uniref:phosphoenolpyruvate--glycerone phosphotransferase n=1 Tax=Mycolicibacterium komossense TaxID=1779 RepID=A0ABT3CGV7_9MYCO|nr:dihydroxyacetone kinase phosphoryl donor subunit DhaM [Mycolicibacterium komossense]MCV7228588.1 HPr family phosphocarrier protein [Mycolicibacterium komossense]